MLAMQFERVRAIISQPEEAWRKIKEEKTSARQILIEYAAPLVLVPILSACVRLILLRTRFITFPFIFNLFLSSLVNYILYLTALLFAAWLISILARYFSSKTDIDSAVKVVVYSMTPIWLSAVFQIFSRLSALGLLGLYSAYLLFSALPIVLETPGEKVVGFSAAVIGIGIVIMMYLSLISGGIFYS